MSEQNYDFRERLLAVHKKNRRMPGSPADTQFEITGEWRIVRPAGSTFLSDCAADLQDYFSVSMGISLSCTEEGGTEKTVTYEVDPNLPGENSFRVDAAPGRIRLIGQNERAAAQAGYLLEDMLNMEEAPFLTPGVTDRTPIFRCRMIHSGYGIDQFPDAHLNAIAHAGINAILLFVRDVNRTSVGELDFNDLIRRAARFGVDVYAYSYMKSRVHPLTKAPRNSTTDSTADCSAHVRV